MKMWNLLSDSYPSWESIDQIAVLKIIKCDNITLQPLTPEEPRFIRVKIALAFWNDDVVMTLMDGNYDMLETYENGDRVPDDIRSSYFIKWESSRYRYSKGHKTFMAHSWMLESDFIFRLTDHIYYDDEDDFPAYCGVCNQKMQIVRPGKFQCVNEECEDCR